MFFSKKKTRTDSVIEKTLDNFIQRFPKYFDKSLIKEKERLFLTSPVEFVSLRSKRHLLKIILTHFFFRKATNSRIEGEGKRVLLLKAIKTRLQFPFGTKTVLGLVIFLHPLKDYEKFSKRHILYALRKFIPHVRIYSDSYFSTFDGVESLLRVYLEVERGDGKALTESGIKKIQTELSAELHKSIQTLSPSLFAPRNEREFERQIALLSHELEKGGDLPQVMVCFRSQTESSLKFDVICARSKSQYGPTLRALSKQVAQSIFVLFETEFLLGSLANGYVKEASVFVIEVKNKPFLRKDLSIDLIEARGHVVQTLFNLIGPFRDYNGGLLQKQNEQFALLLSHFNLKDDFLLRTFFYSISPVPMQGCLELDLLIPFAESFLSAYETPLQKKQQWVRKSKKVPGRGTLFFIKSSEEELVELLARRLEEKYFDSLEYALSVVQLGGVHILGFLHLSQIKKQVSDLDRFIEKTIVNAQRVKQTLRIPISTFPFTLDPHVGIDRECRIIQRALYEGLTRVGLNGEVQNAVCKKVTLSPCEKKYIFTLREAFWSNSEKLTAHDFVASWQKAVLPSSDSLCVDHFSPILNAQKINQGMAPIDSLGVRALDDTTLLVELEYRAPYFLELVASSFFFPLYRGHELEKGMVCNGPFKINKSRSKRQLFLKKNLAYWDRARVKLEKVEVVAIQDPAFQVDLFNKGELDWAGCPFKHLPLSTLQKSDLVQLFPVNQVFVFSCNSTHPLLKHPKMRQALSLSLDRIEIVGAFFNINSPTTTLLPENTQATSECGFDPQGASHLVDQVLEELDIKKARLSPIRLSHSDISGQKEVACLAANQWERYLGIKVVTEELKKTHFFGKLGAGELEIGGCLWDSPVMDPIGVLEAYNLLSWGHKGSQVERDEYRRRIQKTIDAISPSKRKALLLDAQAHVLESRGLIPVYTETFKFLKNKSVKDVFISQTGQIDLKWAYIDEKN